MKNIIALLLLTGFIFAGCKDIYTEQYLSLEPVYQSFEDFRASVKMGSQQDLVKPGKIYTIGSYIFINENMKGVHVYNNVNPASPQYAGFINIPGNVDIAVKNSIMARNAGKNVIRSSFRPTKNAKNMKSGKRTPNIRTGGLV